MIINCHTDINLFIDKPMPKVSQKVGLEIAEQLFAELDKPANIGSNGIGLAANQVGIEAAVAVINVTEPLILINPTIVDIWGKIPFKREGCLSYPGTWINTVRYKNIIIQTAQEESNWYFSGLDETKLLEAGAVQHEIDHLNGKTILDHKNKPISTNKTPNRNDPCPCDSGKKYKKCCL